MLKGFPLDIWGLSKILGLNMLLSVEVFQYTVIEQEPTAAWFML